ncbi:MAG: Fe-S cluster assembly protein SufD [Proteobacteria bacterium]|nr:Fe-S cluster assembly protein SufD [Pseudomonadota bacterium]
MANVLPMRTPAETALIERFKAEQSSLPGAVEARAEAFARFEKSGLPSRRVEAYHYTDLRNLMREAAPAITARPEPRAPEKHHLLIENGVYLGGDAPEGILVLPLAEALREGRVALGAAMGAASDIVVDLNTALCRDGIYVRVDTVVEAPLFIGFAETLGNAASVMPRVVVEVAAGAALTLVELHAGPDGIAYQKNAVVELILGDGAKVEHIRINEGGDKALMLSTLAVKLGAEAELMSLGLVSGGEVSRHQVFVTYAGENAKIDLRGATMIKGRQHADNTLVVDHAVPNGVSRELFRNVIDDEAQGVFQGRIIVRPHAQKTDGQMASNAVLLSDGAGMANKPELEIFADDVVCAHGATSGALDENQLFYLMARGLPRSEAEALLVEAFLGETLDAVSNDGLREVLAERISRWLEARAR